MVVLMGKVQMDYDGILLVSQAAGLRDQQQPNTEYNPAKNDLRQVSLACLFGCTIVDAWSKSASKEQLAQQVGQDLSRTVCESDLHS